MTRPRDIFDHNRRAWDRQARSGESPWCRPVGLDVTAAARRGTWQVRLTPNLPVPADWFGDVRGKRILGLASGGGQQAPVLAAAGAEVTSLDASEEQLALDARVAERDGLSLRTVRGDMTDLSAFEDASFDLIFHPVANVFVRDVSTVWRGCHRLLDSGGRMLSGFMNPDFFLFDHEALERGAVPEVRFALPFAEVDDLPDARLRKRVTDGEPLEFSHSLDVQIGGQIAAGFVIAGFYEDRWNAEATPLDRYMPTSMATLALKS